MCRVATRKRVPRKAPPSAGSDTTAQPVLPVTDASAGGDGLVMARFGDAVGGAVRTDLVAGGGFAWLAIDAEPGASAGYGAEVVLTHGSVVMGAVALCMVPAGRPFACRRFSVQDDAGLCVRRAKAIDPMRTPSGDEGAALSRFGGPRDNGGCLSLVGNAVNAKEDDEGDLRTTLLGKRNKPWDQVAQKISYHRFDDFPKELMDRRKPSSCARKILVLAGPTLSSPSFAIA